MAERRRQAGGEGRGVGQRGTHTHTHMEIHAEMHMHGLTGTYAWECKKYKHADEIRSQQTNRAIMFIMFK